MWGCKAVKIKSSNEGIKTMAIEKKSLISNKAVNTKSRSKVTPAAPKLQTANSLRTASSALRTASSALRTASAATRAVTAIKLGKKFTTAKIMY